jgi:lysophospholipase L1-like esterase
MMIKMVDSINAVICKYFGFKIGRSIERLYKNQSRIAHDVIQAPQSVGTRLIASAALKIAIVLMLFAVSGARAQQGDNVPAPNGEVITGDGPQLFQTLPDNFSPPITLLNAGVPLIIDGRDETGEWLHVTAESEGWIRADAVITSIDILTLPIIEITPEMVLESTLFYNLDSPTAREIFLEGQIMGNRPDFFSKVGDSITAQQQYLRLFGQGVYNLYETYGYLQPVIDWFGTGSPNSFAMQSYAAETGWTSASVLRPQAADPDCLPSESPLTCEYRRNQPSIALIMLGTNDVGILSSAEYDANMRRIVEITLQNGTIPVLSTIPPRLGFEDTVYYYNLVVIQIALDYDIPLWNYWRAMVALPNWGLSTDGVHPSLPEFGVGSTDLSPENLQYGYPIRNLMALQVLYYLLYETMYPEA